MDGCIDFVQLGFRKREFRQDIRILEFLRGGIAKIRPASIQGIPDRRLTFILLTRESFPDSE